ncbi:MAG TPA: TrkA family potassium uptake protein [Clostridia bacterium]|nr:TrkA family potassium uptake protein [Clostridia bacterium]
MKQYAIIGLGRFGTSLALTLQELGQEVLGIDANEEIVNNLSGKLTHIIQADAADENVLKSLGIRNFDVVVVSMGLDLESSILITLHCKEMGVPKVIVKATDDLHSRILYKIGADSVILPEQEMGIRVARNLISGSVLEYIELSSEYTLVEIKALPAWQNKTLRDLNIRTKYGVNIMAIKRNDGDMNIAPTASDKIGADDILVVIGHKDNINKLEKL